MIDQPFPQALHRWALAPLLLILPAAASLGFTIPGDPADGEIRFDNGTVNTASEEISIGHRGTNGTELATAIYLFELPALVAGEVNNAALEFSYLDRSGSFATNPANADIWGLGYVATTAIDTNWHLLGDADTRTGADLGTGIGANSVVRLSDDFLDNNSNEPADDPYRMTFPGESLSSFLNLLYSEGAVSGDYAVIRINIDAPTSAGNRGFDLASANATDESTRPVLSINETSILMLDPFTDGDRTNGDDPLDTDWYKISGSLNLLVADDSAGIGDGNALNVEMLSTGRRFLCSFPPVTLAKPGDFIQMTSTFRPIFVLGADEAFRMGIVNSGGAPLAGDTTSSGDAANHEGYLVRMSTGSNGDLSTVGVPTGSFLGGSTDFLSRKANIFPVNDPDVHTLVYTITRTSATQMTTRVKLSKAGSVALLNGMDPGTDARPQFIQFYDTFDTLGMGAGNSSEGIDFFLDNVLVESSVPLVQIVPHVVVPADVIELEVETQPNVRYSLQKATDLVSSNWTDSGYILTGDGGVLRVYDPDAVGSEELYRMENQ